MEKHKRKPSKEFRIGDRVMYTPPAGENFHNAKRTAVVAGLPFELEHLGVVLPVAWDDMGGLEGHALAHNFTLIEVFKEIQNEYGETEVVAYREVIEI